MLAISSLTEPPFFFSVADSMRQALPYILASVLVVTLGEIIYLCRKVCRHRQMVYTLISGITFILAGRCCLGAGITGRKLYPVLPLPHPRTDHFGGTCRLYKYIQSRSLL